MTEQPVPQEVKGSGLTLKEGEDVNKATVLSQNHIFTIPAFVLKLHPECKDERWFKSMINAPAIWHMYAATKAHCSVMNWT